MTLFFIVLLFPKYVWLPEVHDIKVTKVLSVSNLIQSTEADDKRGN